MKNIIKLLVISVLFIVALLLSVTANAQVGIGTTNPHQASILELDAPDKGFLPTRVALQGKTNPAPIATLPGDIPAGLFVFNTAEITTAGEELKANQYYGWTGTEWSLFIDDTTLSSALEDLNIPKTVASARENNMQFMSDNATVVVDFTSALTNDGNFNLATDTYTVPAGGDGLYEVIASLSIDTNTSNNNASFYVNYAGVRDQLATERDFNHNFFLTLSGTTVLNLVAGDTIHLTVSTCNGCTATSYRFNNKVLSIKRVSF